MTSLTLQMLLETLNYSQENGTFHWKRTMSSRALAGQRSGNLSPHGYIRIRVGGSLHYAHRLAWLYVTGRWPEFMIDHINGDRSDNRFANLRDVPRQLNNQNKRKAKRSNKSGVLGVTERARAGGAVRYVASVGGKHVGVFDHAAEAHEAYVKAKRQTHQGCTL